MAAESNTVTVRQTASPIRRPKDQRDTLYAGWLRAVERSRGWASPNP